MMLSQLVKFAVLLLTIICYGIMALPVSQDLIEVTVGESFTFSCGPSRDPLDLISITLNDNELPQGIVTQIDTFDNGTVLYQYRNTTIEDDATKIVCSAGGDEGTINLTVFYGPRLIVDGAAGNFTVQEGMDFTVSLSVDANPLPDPYVLYFQNAIISDVYTNTTNIHFVNISRNKSGEYSLKISNNINAIYINFTLEVIYPPRFVNPYLPEQCYPVGINVTYNCSAVSEVEGNPPPNVTANVMQTQVDTVNLSDDAVMIKEGKMEYIVNVTCSADNGVAPSATAMGSIRFGSAPGRIEDIQIQPDFKALHITWTAQTDTGCAQPVMYKGQVLQVDTDEVVSLISTTENSHTVRGLYQDTQYIVLLQAVNELGASGFVNRTAWTKAITISLTAFDVRILGSTYSVEVTWDFTYAGVNDFTITIHYQRIVDGIPQGNMSRSVGGDDRMMTLDLEEDSRYRITIYVVATNETGVSATDMREIDTATVIPPTGGAVMSAVKTSKLIVAMMLLALVHTML